ncbi:MAG: hypothetical protein IT365_25710, partial [Candidatus Hydrogenedentes bacterium]|nr:hypothetical protein [Candidatus Hydrogenedentota bacterium]
MKPYSRLSRLFALAILVTAFVPILGCPTQNQGQQALLDRVDALEDGLAAAQSELGSVMADLATVQATLAEAQTKLTHMSIEEGALNGLNGPHLIIEGCNVHVRSGSGDTEDAEGLTGLGNLIIGYNEPPDPVVHGRLGSHNLVLGSFHEYSSWGGLVAGYHNAVTGRFSSASGGSFNLASGDGSSASGGQN